MGQLAGSGAAPGAQPRGNPRRGSAEPGSRPAGQATAALKYFGPSADKRGCVAAARSAAAAGTPARSVREAESPFLAGKNPATHPCRSLPVPHRRGQGRVSVPPGTAGRNAQGAAPALPRRGDGCGRVEVRGRGVDPDQTHPPSPRRLPVWRCEVPAALPAQRAAELRRARQTGGFSGEAAAGSGSDRAAAPLALPRHRARREAGGGRHGEQAGAGPGRSLPAGGGRPPPGGCAPPRRQRRASRRRPPPACPAATGGCHSSAPREPPRGNGRQAAAQGDVGGWRLPGAKLSRLLCRVPGGARPRRR
ncbi:unnamed protein product [Coccothraustes coccothraustes]